MACSAGPPSLGLQLLDKDQSVFLTGRFKAGDIQVVDDQGKQIRFTYDSFEGFDRLMLNFDSQTGLKRIILKLSATFSVPVEVEIVERNGDCCTNFFVEDVKSLTYPIEIDAEKGILKIRM